LLESLAARGAEQRARSERSLSALLNAGFTGDALHRVDVRQLLLRQVDITGVRARVDLDGAARRLRMHALVEGLSADSAVGHIDLDAVVAGVELDEANHRIGVDADVLGLRARRRGSRRQKA
jgi:hypothetical protein